MKRLAPCLASLAMLLAGPSAHALELSSEIYVVGSLGQSIIEHTPMQAQDNILATKGIWTIRNLHSSQTSSKGAFKLQLGYEFTPTLAIEGGYVDLGKTTYNARYTSFSGVVLPFFFATVDGPTSATREARLTGWNVTGLGSYPINDKLSAFAKLGVIHAEVRTKDSGGGFGVAGNVTETKWRPTYGLGAAYKYNKTLGIRAEYEKFSKLGDEQTTGTADVNLMSIGLTAKF